ncbi:MAG: acyl-CoA thioesterase [Alphaproteobacteria bacterium]|nr:acyl-CoA thioesterase [Alphaproteobacteria bacterium]
MPKNTEQSFDNLQAWPPEIEGRVPTIRVIAMPADANPAGDIFGGWILSEMDLAGSAHAYRYAGQRVVTVGVQAMTFHKPVFIGDQVGFYTSIERVGKTSITVKIESWAFRREHGQIEKVTEGLFTYVTIDEKRRPVSIAER